jgi:hypothetical protein
MMPNLEVGIAANYQQHLRAFPKPSFLTHPQTTLISAVKNPFQNLSSSGTFLKGFGSDHWLRTRLDRRTAS